jgi:uncharacterized protein involved in exopolysaccharide biosynthesis
MDDAAPVSTFAFVAAILSARVFIVRVGIVFGVIAAAMTFRGAPQYTSVTTFVPQSRRQTSSLSGLAAQFGLSVPATDGGQSPAFYVDLLTSREILGPTAMARYAVGGDAKSDTVLAVYLGARGKTPEQLRDRGAVSLRNHISAVNNIKTGVVTLKVTTNDPRLSSAVATRLLAALDGFNQDRRRTQAVAERQFTERRLAEVASELRAAENAAQNFLQRNRDYRSSPELTFAYDRMSREVTMRQQLYTSLAQAYEQAKIEEVRDTPVISVVERPEVPAFPDGRGTLRWAMIGVIVGVGLGVVVIAIRTIAMPVATAGGGYADMIGQWREVRSDFRRPWQFITGPSTRVE